MTKTFLLPFIALSICACSVAACSIDGATSGAGGFGGGGPKPDAEYDTAVFSVAPGSEETWCTFFQTDNTEPVDVQKFVTDQGGHHVVLYTVDHAIDQAPTRCPQGGQMNWVNVAVAQTHHSETVFPSGVGFTLGAHQQMVAEVHVINATPKDIAGAAKIQMFYAPKGSVAQHASVFYFGSTNIDSKPHATSSARGSCKPPFPLTLRSGMAHQHAYGTGINVDILRAGGAEHIYDSTSWDEAPIKTWDTGIMVGADERVDVTCEYDNTGSTEQGYPHQMCWWLGYHWGPAEPEVGFYCMSAGGGADDACTCIAYGGGNGKGGGSVSLNVSRAATIAGVAGPLDAGSPIYCFLVDPSNPATPLYYGNAVDALPLTDTASNVLITIDDVAPGTYAVSCQMDLVHGGVLPGKGDAASSSPPIVTVAVGDSASQDVVLDIAIP